MATPSSRQGWTVTFAGTGINLALGVLYSWSVIQQAIPESWGWTNADKALPYAIACIVFAIAMVPAGRLQDVIGPRWVATLGGILTGIGCIVAALAGSSLLGFVLGFGVLGGAGIGFGYAAATPPAVKWFPPQKTGLIAGLVVAGFGLASVYIAPLANWLLGTFSVETADGVVERGVSSTMMVFGIAFLLAVTALSQLLRNPPPGYKPEGAANGAGAAAAAPPINLSYRDMLRSGQFYVLWLMFFAGSAAGLTFISVAAGLGRQSLGDLAFFAVAVLAVGNAGGRILAGAISDRIGRQWSIFLFMVLQALVVGILYGVKGGAGWPLMLLIVLFIGVNYGSNLALFPSVVKDYFGLKNFGLNYGALFTAWGVAGFVMPWLNGWIQDLTGSQDASYFIIIGMLVVAAGLTFLSRTLSQRTLAAAA